MSDTCVSTWRTKVLVGFQGCLIHAVDELERHADRLRRLIKSKDSWLSICSQTIYVYRAVLRSNNV